MYHDKYNTQFDKICDKWQINAHNLRFERLKILNLSI